MRAQLLGAFGTLSLGMRVLADEGVRLDAMFAHGGVFRTAGVAQPSHVLLAMGAGEPRARGSLRFSLGRTSTREDVAAVGAVLR